MILLLIYEKAQHVQTSRRWTEHVENLMLD